ncbi:hypothetical protein GF312_17435 [Candidatus Poribacteria bacterium]|nr:hypothetical protein [Candidatus Poribacteria bacterium]
MKREFLIFTVFILTVIFLGSANAGEWIEEDMFTAPEVSIAVDGDPADWAGIEPLIGVEFKTTADEWVVFEEYNGGVWNGPEDQTVSVAFAWDPSAIYIYIMVVDDEHQNNDSWFDGDAAQLVFADADRTAHTYLYNFALNDAQNEILIGNETAEAGGLTPDDVVIVRDDATNTTFYEARFAPAILGLDSLEMDMAIGVGICVNDGDVDTPGQKGWGGWGPHAAVYGKNGDKTGLVILGAPVAAAVDPDSKMSTTWGGLK